MTQGKLTSFIGSHTDKEVDATTADIVGCGHREAVQRVRHQSVYRPRDVTRCVRQRPTVVLDTPQSRFIMPEDSVHSITICSTPPQCDRFRGFRFEDKHRRRTSRVY